MSDCCSRRDCIDFLGVCVDKVDTSALVDAITSFALGQEQKTVMYVNADCMLLSQKNIEYRDALNRAGLVYADGIGVVLGARLWGHHLPGRSTAADFIYDVCRKCAVEEVPIFLLGAAEGVAKEAAKRLVQLVPGLEIAGTHHGYFSAHESDRIIDMINSSGAKLLVVGFGAPKQELWMLEHASRLAPRCLWGVGGLFDFVSGRTARGPQWLLDNGFEWLCRLVVEPRRLWKRYIPGNILFVLTVLRHRLFASRKP